MSKQPITKKQMQTLAFIRVYHKRRGYMPSLAEIGKRFNLCISSVWERLDRLEKSGYIERRNSPRWIKIL